MAEPGITVLGGGGMTDPDSAVLGGGGMTDPDSAVLGGGGMTDPDSAVHGGSGISDPDSAVDGGGGIAEQEESAVLGGGGITSPPSPRSRWDVSQVQLAGELSHSKSGGESGPLSSAPKPADQAALAPISILPIVRLTRRFRNRREG